MKLVNERLYLEFNDAIDSGISSNTILRAKDRTKEKESAIWSFITDPVDARKILIDYECMKDCYKEQIKKRFGNPYEFIAKEPIRKMITKDLEAEKFYLSYRYNETQPLPIDKVKGYTAAANWLNMLIKVGENKKEIKKLLNLSLTDFWIKIGELITTDNIDLPATPRRLWEKIKEYKENGYATLIHKQFGNDRAKKVKTDEAEAQLLTIISKETQPDDVMTCFFYNKWAVANNQPQISAGTVGNYRRNNLASVITGREGSSAFNEKFIRQVKGIKPSTPLYLVEHDDNNLDFLFLDKNGNEFNRYVSIVVIDSCCGLVLGKSYARLTNDMGNTMQLMIRHAYMDAMYYIRSLTGSYYLPWEGKADKYASKALAPFYGKVFDKFVPPSFGNKHRGYIEQFFSSNIWKRSQKIVGEVNWNGNNMTAKYPGVNKEALLINTKSRPLVGEEAELQIENFFQLLRHMPDFTRDNMNAPTKEQQWLEAWNKMTPEQKRPISDEQFLLTFGIKHNPSRPVTLNNRGIEPQINNTHYSYDLPEAWMYNKLIGEQVNVYYDPYDMSRVLCTNGKDIRFIAKSATLIPRALKDQYTGSRTYLNAILAEKKEQVREVSAASATRKAQTNNIYYNAEAVLQGGALIKGIKNEAEIKMIEQDNKGYEQFLDDNNDFNQFFEQ